MQKNLLFLCCLFIVNTLVGQDILVPYKKSDSWGYANRDGEIQIAPQYSTVNFFQGNYALVEKEGKKGYIDKKGNEIIAPKYSAVQKMRGDLFKVTTSKDLEGIVAKGNKTLLKAQYSSIEYATQSIYIVKKKGKMGAVKISPDKKIETIVPIKYKTVAYASFLKRFICNYKDETKHEITLQGEIVSNEALIIKKSQVDDYPSDKVFKGRPVTVATPTNTTEAKKYPIIEILEKGNAKGLKITKQVYHGTKQEEETIEIPAAYQEFDTKYLINNVILAKKEGKWGAITTSNKVLLPFVYDAILSDGVMLKNYSSSFKSLLIVQKEGKWGVVATKNEFLNEGVRTYTIIPFSYDKIQFSKDYSFFITQKNEKYGAVFNTSKLETIAATHPTILGEYKTIKRFKVLFVEQADGSIVYLGENGVSFFE